MFFAEFDQTYDCPEEILNAKTRAPEPVPVFYVLDDPYPEGISSTFGHGENVRGRPDGNVYDEPQVDLTPDGSFIIMDSPSGMSALSGQRVTNIDFTSTEYQCMIK